MRFVLKYLVLRNFDRKTKYIIIWKSYIDQDEYPPLETLPGKVQGQSTSLWGALGEYISRILAKYNKVSIMSNMSEFSKIIVNILAASSKEFHYLVPNAKTKKQQAGLSRATLEISSGFSSISPLRTHQSQSIQ